MTVLIAFLLLAVGLPVALAAARGGGLFGIAGVLVGLFVAGLGIYRLSDRLWRPAG